MIILSLTFYVSAFSSRRPCDKNEEALFLENVMIRHAGLYVLMGSKPMVEFPIDSGFPETEEECRKCWAQRSQDLKSYPDYLEGCLNSSHLHYRKLWDVWSHQLHNTISSSFRMFAINISGRNYGFFVNIPSLLFVIKMHYRELVDIAGKEFNPEELLREIENPQSLFWDLFCRSHYAKGLFFGYGSRNSFLFNYERNNDNILFPRLNDFDAIADLATRRDLDITDLSLPSFASFSLGDEIIEQYRYQRAHIIQILKSKPFVKTVKEWMAAPHLQGECVESKTASPKCQDSSMQKQ